MLAVMAQEQLPFFDFDKAHGGQPGPDVGKDTLPRRKGDGGAMSVSALLVRIKGALADAFPKKVAVVGEISNLKIHTSGHVYFRLKDAQCAIDAAMFKQFASGLKYAPADGLEVVVDGRVDVYDVRGQLQLYVERMTPRGTGALELAFRQLREKLAAEGLFEAEHKKPIAKFPRAIGVVTSQTGAAIRDIRRTLQRRWPAARVYLLPSLVQGEQAARQIAEAVGLLDANAGRLGIETIILARGGGSLEDLWAFNEEIVARAIFAAHTPIISGVGHEVDVTIADLVADVRAATPTAAAVLAVPDAYEVCENLEELAGRLVRRCSEYLNTGRASLEAVLRSWIFRDPAARLRMQIQRLDELSHRLAGGLRARLLTRQRRLEPLSAALAALHPARLKDRAEGRLSQLQHRLAWALGHRSKSFSDRLAALGGRLSIVHLSRRMQLAREKVAAAGRHLEAMSHRSVLHRGFSITRSLAGELIRSVGEAGSGELIETELTDGRFRSRVEAVGDPEGSSQRTSAFETPICESGENKKNTEFPMLF